MFHCAYSGRVWPDPAHSLDARDVREASFLLAWQDGWRRGLDIPPEAFTADPDTQERLRRAIAGLKSHQKDQAGPEPPGPSGTTAWSRALAPHATFRLPADPHQEQATEACATTG
jgi:hypothetical protein